MAFSEGVARQLLAARKRAALMARRVRLDSMASPR
jgi:hypothetical protein